MNKGCLISTPKEHRAQWERQIRKEITTHLMQMKKVPKHRRKASSQIWWFKDSFLNKVILDGKKYGEGANWSKSGSNRRPGDASYCPIMSWRFLKQDKQMIRALRRGHDFFLIKQYIFEFSKTSIYLSFMSFSHSFTHSLNI